MEETPTGACVRFADFNDAVGLKLLRDAAITDNRLRVAPAEQAKGGAAWLTEKQYVGFGFETTFEFQMSGGADGFAFVIQNHRVSIGAHSMHYTMPNSLAVEFDTFSNPTLDDPEGDHISVQTNSDGRNSPNHAFSRGCFVPDFELDDNKPHRVVIRYVPGTLAVFLDDDASPVLKVSVELETTLNLDQGRAWVGFTAGTGARFQTHDILNWEYRPVEPLTAIAQGYLSLAEKERGTARPKRSGNPGSLNSQRPRNVERLVTPDGGSIEPPGPGPPLPPDDLAFLQKALAFYQTFASQNSTDPAAQLEIGKAYWRVGDIQKQLGEEEEAEDTYRMAFGLWERLAKDHPDALESRRYLAELYRRRAETSLRGKQYEKALTFFTKVLELHPDDTVANEARGDAHLELGQYDEAVAEYTKAIELNPKKSNTWNNRGVVYARLGQHRKAIADYNKAIQLNAEEPIRWRNRGRLHARLGQRDKAVADFSRAIELDPDDVDAWHERGLVYRYLGRWAEAVADFSRAIELQSDEPKYWRDRGKAYVKLGQQEQAQTDFDKYIGLLSKPIEQEPDDWSAWNLRGVGYHNLEAWAKAIADFSRAIELKPDEALPWKNRASCHCRQGQWEKALADFAQTTELGMKCIDVFNWYALARLGAGDLTQLPQ